MIFSSQNERQERQKKALEAKVQALENELERARERLKSLRAQADQRVRTLHLTVTVLVYSGLEINARKLAKCE